MTPLNHHQRDLMAKMKHQVCNKHNHLYYKRKLITGKINKQCQSLPQQVKDKVQEFLTLISHPLM